MTETKEILIEAKTQRAAYSKTEDEYWAAFERRKYSDYRSFCECRRRWLKRHRPNLG